jgi:hypothetical protein
MMTEVKLLVHNINDVVNRAAFEKELNVYLKMGWALKGTHQAVSPETGFLMMTAVLEKEVAEDKETPAAKQGTLAELAEESKKKEAGKGGKEETEKQATDAGKQDAVEEGATEGTKQTAGKEKPDPEKQITEDAAMPKGFKIKEPADDSTSPAEETSQETNPTKEESEENEEEKKE